MKPNLCFLYIIVNSILVIWGQDSTVEYFVNMEDKITSVLGQHAVRSFDISQGLKVLNMTADQQKLENYANDDLHALASVRLNHINFLFLPLLSSCSYVNQTYFEYNVTFSRSPLDHGQIGDRFKSLNLMIVKGSDDALVADREVHEELRTISGLFDNYITKILRDLNTYQRLANKKLGELNFEIEELNEKLSEERWKKYTFRGDCQAVNRFEDSKEVLEIQAEYLKKFLDSLAVYVQWTVEMKNELRDNTQDLAVNIDNMKKNLYSKKEWMYYTQNLYKEVNLSKELKGQIYNELNKAMWEILETSCSILKIKNRVSRRDLEYTFANLDDWRSGIGDVICSGDRRAAFDTRNFWTSYWKETLNKLNIK